MDVSTFALVAGGAVVVGVGGYGWFNWNRLFRKPTVQPAPAPVAAPVVKPKRKYTKKPKLSTGEGANLATAQRIQEQRLQEQQMQRSDAVVQKHPNGATAWPFPDPKSMREDAGRQQSQEGEGASE